MLVEDQPNNLANHCSKWQQHNEQNLDWTDESFIATTSIRWSEQLNIDGQKLEQVHTKCNREKTEDHEGLTDLVVDLVVLVSPHDTEAVTVDHHHERLVDPVHCLVLEDEVRFVTFFLKILEAGVLK